MGLQTKIQKQRSSYSNGSHLVLHTWRKCSKVAARSRPCYLCLLIGKVLSLMSTPLQAKLLLNSTTSMFFTGWEMQYEETNCSYGNWRLAASSQPCACSCIMSCAEFFGKTSNHPGDSAPPTAQIWCLATSVFFQNQNHLWKGRDFRLSMRFGKIWEGSWLQFQKKDFAVFWEREEVWEVWENCVRFQGASFEEDWCVIVLCTVFLVPCVFNKCLYLSYYMTHII